MTGTGKKLTPSDDSQIAAFLNPSICSSIASLIDPITTSLIYARLACIGPIFMAISGTGGLELEFSSDIERRGI
jgi:hypothetical protein